jgi:two-component system NtrC family sensor kinase
MPLANSSASPGMDPADAGEMPIRASVQQLDNSPWPPPFAHKFVHWAAVLMDARAALLFLAQVPDTAPVLMAPEASKAQPPDAQTLRRLNQVLIAAATRQSEPVQVRTAAGVLGQELAERLGWHTLTTARLAGGNGELLGLLALADIKKTAPNAVEEGPVAAERPLLQALTAHASEILENARLFTRMEQANRHWIEVFDSITDFIVVHDQSNRVLRVNRALADSIGVRPTQLVGISMWALVSAAPDATGGQGCPFCSDRGQDDEYVHPVLERTYLVSTSQIHGALNEGLQTVHVLKDITDRREAERRYRELFDNIQEGLFFSSPEGRFIEVNDALVRMLGYSSREELLQIDLSSQLYLSPAARQRFEIAMTNSGGILRNFEEVLRRKDGSIIHCLQNVLAVKDPQGRVLQYRGLMLDISDLKNFQAELQRERDFSGKILNHTQSLILVVDTAGLISYANRRCFEAGNYTEADLVGRKVLDLVLPQRRHLAAHSVELCLLGQAVDNLDLPILLGDGRTARFSINLSPMRDEQGAVNSIVVVMTDITDAAMLQAKLMHTEKMAAVGQLVSGVAHEVNNPLTAVLGFADLLLESPDVPETAKRDIAIILQEAQRTKQIVQNLLGFARQLPPQRTQVPINTILRRTLALRSYDLANHGVQVVEHLDPDLPEVVGDAQQLQQVFLNILNNAYDAIRESGRAGEIEVQTTSRNGFAEVIFRDNGDGIRHPDRIFDPFFTTKEVGKGTGLGLSICYGIVREHGGEIVGANNPGALGAAFTVRLPAVSSLHAKSESGGDSGEQTAAAGAGGGR